MGPGGRYQALQVDEGHDVQGEVACGGFTEIKILVSQVTLVLKVASLANQVVYESVW